MFGIYDHPGIVYICRHCGGDAGYDPELCFRCGPLCHGCWADEVYPCDPKQNDFRPVEMIDYEDEWDVDWIEDEDWCDFLRDDPDELDEQEWIAEWDEWCEAYEPVE